METITGKTTLVFDYDGTIHETFRIYGPAMRRAFAWLEQQKRVRVPEVSDRQIESWLGMNVKDMWDSFLPDLSDNLKSEVSGRVGEDMRMLAEQHQAKWYPGMEETLRELRQSGFRMMILSNCGVSYRDTHWEKFRMDRFFDRFLDCESFGYAPKEQILKQITEEEPGQYVVIGDRDSDYRGAAANGLPFIGCLYGYGSEDELSGADHLIRTPSELTDALRNILVSQL